MKIAMRSIFILFVAGTLAAFTSSTIKKIDVKESTITWTGKKVIGNSHTGTIDLKSGHLEMDGDQLTGGEFVVDMTTITNTDLGERGKGRLEGHLKSDDFFDVANHPEATLVITSAAKNGASYAVNADLTIKGLTEAISFDMVMGDGQARANFEFDRSKHQVKFGSGSFFDDLGDKAISDNILLDVLLKF